MALNKSPHFVLASPLLAIMTTYCTAVSGFDSWHWLLSATSASAGNRGNGANSANRIPVALVGDVDGVLNSWSANSLNRGDKFLFQVNKTGLLEFISYFSVLKKKKEAWFLNKDFCEAIV